MKSDSGYLESSSNILYYRIKLPTVNNYSGIVFVHAADANRLGPHRMFVEAEKVFNDNGFSTMRFDLTGCGDSSGTYDPQNIEQDISDVASAIRFFISDYDIKTIILFGISRGAKVIIQTMQNFALPLSGAICLSAPEASMNTSIRKLSDISKNYIYKMLNTHNLKKVFTGRVDLCQILKTFSLPIRNIANANNTNKSEKFRTICPTLIIYGSSDPVTTQSLKYYSNLFKNNKISFESFVIKNANHSFFHYKWKQKIISKSIEWLNSIENEKCN